MFCRFGQMSHDMYPPLRRHTGWSHCPKTLRGHPFTPPPLSLPTTADPSLSPLRCLFQNVLEARSHSMQPFQTGSFPYGGAFNFLPVFSRLAGGLWKREAEFYFPPCEAPGKAVRLGCARGCEEERITPMPRAKPDYRGHARRTLLEPGAPPVPHARAASWQTPVATQPCTTFQKLIFNSL